MSQRKVLRACFNADEKLKMRLMFFLQKPHEYMRCRETYSESFRLNTTPDLQGSYGTQPSDA